MKRKYKARTPKQKWSFRRNFQYKGILARTKGSFNQILQENNSSNNPLLTIEESLKLCKIQDLLNSIIKNYDKNTDILKSHAE